VILPSGRTYGFGYDPNGNRTSIMMPSGAVHGLGYNKINLDNAYVPPGNPAYGTQYNLDREWKRTTLPSGRAIDGAYDNGGRLRDVTYPEGAVALSYFDNTDRVGTLTRASATDNQAIAFSYDGFLTTRIVYSGVANGEYRYAFDNNFWLMSVALDNVWTTLGRDADGLLTRYGPFTMTRSGPAGAPSALTDNTLNVSYTYDSFGRLYTRTHTLAGQTVYAIQFGYDNVGRIVQKIETVSGTAHTFDYSYDLDGQLVDVRKDGTLVEQYSYDNNANRTSALTATAAYDDQDRLIQQGGVNYTFDDDGYLNTRGSNTFQYSARGELLNATVAGQTITYHYDGIGRRIGRTDASGVVQYLYGNPGIPFRLTATRDASGVLTTYYYDVGGNLLSFERSGQRYYVATDQLGTPKAVTDSTGNTVKIVEYDAWGVKLSDSNPTFELPIGFAGGIADGATWLVRFGWRDYEAGTGRWQSRDPILFRGGQANLFNYTFNDPLNYRDPTGNSGFVGAGIGFVSGAVGGYITSGSFTGTAVGALAGAAVGFITPTASTTAGASAAAFISGYGGSIAGQVGGNLVSGNAPLDNFSLLAAIGAGAGAGSAAVLGSGLLADAFFSRTMGIVVQGSVEGVFSGLGELAGFRLGRYLSRQPCPAR
jgi:RHS repeat-associated protein